MATTQRVSSEPAARSYDNASDGEGWLLFAAMMIGLAGTLNVIWGIAAIGTSSFFVADARFIFSDLNTWGWIILLIGAVEITASVGIWAGVGFARWVGIAVAGLNAIAALLAIPAYPFW